MRTVNALKIGNNLGEVLDLLDDTGEPILASKERKPRAVPITPEQFKKRFLDYQARERREQLLETKKNLREGLTGYDATYADLAVELKGKRLPRSFFSASTTREVAIPAARIQAHESMPMALDWNRWFISGK